MDHIFNVCGKSYPEVLGQLDYVAKKANTGVGYQELIEELHYTYQIQETSRKKLDYDETETDVALSVVIFEESAGSMERMGTRQKTVPTQRGPI